MGVVFRIIDSARKSFSDETIFYVYHHVIYKAVMRSDPPKTLLIGIDSSMRPIELIEVVNDDGTKVIIHARPATKHNLRRMRNHD